MIETKPRIKQCNRGQLFRAGWLSSHRVVVLSFLRSQISLAIIWARHIFGWLNLTDCVYLQHFRLRFLVFYSLLYWAMLDKLIRYITRAVQPAFLQRGLLDPTLATKIRQFEEQEEDWNTQFWPRHLSPGRNGKEEQSQFSSFPFPAAFAIRMVWKMAATKQESKAITLKGSAELVTEFFGKSLFFIHFWSNHALF